MNRAINEVLAARVSEKPLQISHQAGELLNLRRLPAMLNMAQTAVLLGLAEQDIPVLIGVGLLKPLGNPPANAVKHFATLQVMELAGEITQLGKIRNAVYEHWRAKNAQKTSADLKPRSLHNGQR